MVFTPKGNCTGAGSARDLQAEGVPGQSTGCLDTSGLASPGLTGAEPRQPVAEQAVALPMPLHSC